MNLVPRNNLDAYATLYQIETLLNDILLSNPAYYDADKLPNSLTLTNLHDELLKQYKKGNRAVSLHTIRFLYRSIKIRNKVCHMTPINGEELGRLKLCLKLVIMDIKTRNAALDKPINIS